MKSSAISLHHKHGDFLKFLFGAVFSLNFHSIYEKMFEYVYVLLVSQEIRST